MLISSLPNISKYTVIVYKLVDSTECTDHATMKFLPLGQLFCIMFLLKRMNLLNYGLNNTFEQIQKIYERLLDHYLKFCK